MIKFQADSQFNEVIRFTMDNTQIGQFRSYSRIFVVKHNNERLHKKAISCRFLSTAQNL
jgi:hypothetical protein